MILECLLLLCQTRNSREYLRKHKTYPIIRNLDELISHETINEKIYELVNFLVRDEETNDLQ